MLVQGNQGQVGKAVGQGQVLSLGEFAEALITQLHGKFYENTYRGNKFSCSTPGGGVATAATQLFSTAVGTFTPILAVYNPLTNNKNLVIEQLWCGLTASPLATATQTGSYLLVVGSGQTITNAQSATPVNNLTLKAAGSSAIGISNVALAGASVNPIVLRPTSGDVELVTSTANATAVVGSITVEEISGSIIVPPGGYLGIAMGISNAVAGHFTTAGFTWDEVPV